MSKLCSNGTTIFNILDNTTELYMTIYIIGEIFSSGGATLYKNPSDQTSVVFQFSKLVYQFSKTGILVSKLVGDSDRPLVGIVVSR